MALKVETSAEEMAGRFEAFARMVEEERLRLLQQVGEEAVSHARDDHPNDWDDQTGNLRSSVGYALYDDGASVRESYKPAGTALGDGLEGVEAGRALADEVGRGTRVLTLVVTAGMPYASAVEARGRDVLSGAKLRAEASLKTGASVLASDVRKAWRRAVQGKKK